MINGPTTSSEFCPSWKSKLSIKNSASLEQIRDSKNFRILQDFLEERDIVRNLSKNINLQGEKIPLWVDENILESYSFLSDSIQSGSIENIDIEELRVLRQAMNNQICFYAFCTFLDEISDFWEDEIPCMEKNNEEKIIMKPINIEEFINMENMDSFMFSKDREIDLDKLKGFWSILEQDNENTFTTQTKFQITYYYLSIFSENLQKYFSTQIDEIFKGSIWKEIQDIVDVYLFLESFIMNHYAAHYDGEKYSTISSNIAMYGNYEPTIRFIHHHFKTKKDIPTLEEIRNFIIRHNKSSFKKLNDMEDSFYRALWEVVYNKEEGVFDTHKKTPFPKLRLERKSLWWCPFGRIQSPHTWEKETPKIALMDLVHTLDWYYINILRELGNRWILSKRQSWEDIHGTVIWKVDEIL